MTSTPLTRLLTRLPLVAVLAALACGGSSAPPPPVAAASPTPAGEPGLRPLSSREGAPPATAGAIDPSAPLPPGHPPIGTPDPHGNVPGASATSAGSISGTVTLSGTLAVSPADVMYLMAKKGNATVAVRRIEKPSFPYAFEISSGDAMMAGAAFEGPVDVVARISRTGDAIPAKGDLEGVTKGVAIPSKGVAVSIDTVRP